MALMMFTLFFNQSQGTTNTLASVSGMVGNSVLNTKAPGEDMSTLSNAQGGMQVSIHFGGTYIYTIYYLYTAQCIPTIHPYKEYTI